MVDPIGWSEFILHIETNEPDTKSGSYVVRVGSRFPSLAMPEPAYHGLNFSETFGDLAFTTFSHAVSLRDLVQRRVLE